MKRLLVCLFIFNVLWLNAQSVNSALDEIKRSRPNKAFEILSVLLDEGKESVGMYYALATVYASRQFKEHDLLKGYNYILKAQKLKRAQEFEKLGEFNPSEALLKSLRENIEFEILFTINKHRSLKTAKDYISTYPGAYNHTEAVNLLHELAFESAERIGSIESYNQFIKDYPAALQIQLAVVKRNQRAFELTKDKRTIAAYDEFIALYPDAKQVKQATRERDDLVYLTLLEKSDSLKTIKNSEMLARSNQKAAETRLLIIGLFISGVCITIILYALYYISKDKKQIEGANEEIRKQKEIIEYNNLKTIDSIRYAKFIQEAVFPSSYELVSSFKDAFVYYKPKDIVSGDFFWISQNEHRTVLVCADCTGHGVPGAFMSLIGYTLLNQIVNIERVSDPAMVLNRMRNDLIALLRQQEQRMVAQDGIDLAMCVIDREKLTFAGAYNPLWLFQNGELTEITATKRPIGNFIIREKDPFVKHEIYLEPGDSFYVFTDGYPDQFGGPDNKKFGLRRLKKLIRDNASLPMHEQKLLLDAQMKSWRREEEQIDDILVIGVRV